MVPNRYALTLFLSALLVLQQVLRDSQQSLLRRSQSTISALATQGLSSITDCMTVMPPVSNAIIT